MVSFGISTIIGNILSLLLTFIVIDLDTNYEEIKMLCTSKTNLNVIFVSKCMYIRLS